MSQLMECKETHSSSGYGKPPWVFKGSALYQLHLVKAETARAFIPKEFRLVEAFGYTIGGFFLANYDHSPAGTFDEKMHFWKERCIDALSLSYHKVMLTSKSSACGDCRHCMEPTNILWAARVLVNNDEACIHGRKDVGLPSQVARFSKTTRTIPRTPKTKTSGFIDMVGMFSSDRPKSSMDIQVSEIKGLTAINICSINFSSAVPELDFNKWMGPLVKMSLPSFSGRTKHNPHLLKYSCQIECRVRAVAPAKVLGPPPAVDVDVDEEKSSRELNKKKRSLSILVMLSKPILALEFNCLEMKVDAPTIVSKHSQKKRGTSAYQ